MSWRDFKKLSFKRKILKKNKFNPTVLWLRIYLLDFSVHSVYFLLSGLEQWLGDREVGQGFP